MFFNFMMESAKLGGADLQQIQPWIYNQPCLDVHIIVMTVPPTTYCL